MSRTTLDDRFSSGKPLFTLEFFPPKTDAAAEQMLKAAGRLRACGPDFVSITYGAGGGTRERTLAYAKRLSEEFGYDVMPHLTCVGHSRDELRGIVTGFRGAGLEKIMALRGDPPKGQKDFKPHPDGLSYANELIALIREIYPDCAIGAAGYPEKHPEAPSFEEDLVNLKRKVDAGANFVTTQLFFTNDFYFRFVENCREAGISVPILPGLMCVTNREQTKNFCALCGTEVPEDLDKRLEAAGDDAEAVREVGVDWAYHQARELLERGAPGIHLYILNRAKPAIALMKRLQADGFYADAPNPEPEGAA